MTAPTLDRSVVTIVDRENVLLAAVVSSYISNADRYTPIFGFPGVHDARRDVQGIQDDDYIANVIGGLQAVFLHNAIARLRDVKVVVLAGLSDVQKSYLKFDAGVSIVEVKSPEEAPSIMAASGFKRAEIVRCREQDALIGLKLAIESGRALTIDNAHARLTPESENRQGLVVIEARMDHVASVVAVNYACAIKADVKFAHPLDGDGRRRILDQLHSWKALSDDAARAYVVGEIIDRIADSDISSHSFVTFFTDGVPYPIALRTNVPISLVNLSDRVEHFILNAILAEEEAETTSAVVFSLEEELGHAEGRWLENALERNGWAVRGLYDEAATHNAFDYHAQHYVYRLLHIASHGRALDGYSSVEEFTDRDGLLHIFEYDEIVNFTPPALPHGDMVACTRKVVPRKLDGMAWDSDDLRGLGLPDYVFDDLKLAIFGPDWGENTTRISKSRIGEGYVVQCHDSFHQGLLRVVAAHASPFVFNNSCSSWGDMASAFISVGARAYIGTFWNVSNDAALAFAKDFYSRVFDETILEAIHQASAALSGRDAKIYVLWGLHFSTLKRGKSVSQSTKAIADGMFRSLNMWLNGVDSATSDEVRENAIEVATLLARDILEHLSSQSARSLSSAVNARLKPWGKSL